MSDEDTPTDEHAFRQNEQELEWLRDALRDRIIYVEDSELKREIFQWIRDSLTVPGGDVEEYLETELSKLESEYKMYDHEGVDDGEDAFPDECEDCTHYGAGCPIVTQSTPQDEFNRIARESSSSSEFKRGVRKLARLYECHRIPGWISEWETRYEDIIDEGWDLFERADIDLGEMDSPGAEPRVDVTAEAATDGGAD
jgi:hypothetical protein